MIIEFYFSLIFPVKVMRQSYHTSEETEFPEEASAFAKLYQRVKQATKVNNSSKEEIVEGTCKSNQKST
jgi:hypothetical protein